MYPDEARCPRVPSCEVTIDMVPTTCHDGCMTSIIGKRQSQDVAAAKRLGQDKLGSFPVVQNKPGRPDMQILSTGNESSIITG